MNGKRPGRQACPAKSACNRINSSAKFISKRAAAALLRLPFAALRKASYKFPKSMNCVNRLSKLFAIKIREVGLID